MSSLLPCSPCPLPVLPFCPFPSLFPPLKFVDPNWDLNYHVCPFNLWSPPPSLSLFPRLLCSLLFIIKPCDLSSRVSSSPYLLDELHIVSFNEILLPVCPVSQTHRFHSSDCGKTPSSMVCCASIREHAVPACVSFVVLAAFLLSA